VAPLFLSGEKGTCMNRKIKGFDNAIYGIDIIDAIRYAGLEDRPLEYANFNNELNAIELHFGGESECMVRHNADTGKDETVAIKETRLCLTVYTDEHWSLEPEVFDYRDSKEFLNRVKDIKKKFPEIRERDIVNLINPDMSIREYRTAVTKAHHDIYEYDRQQALRLRLQGYTFSHIANKLECSESRVRALISQPNPPTHVFVD
jgi:hypothetical protein